MLGRPGKPEPSSQRRVPASAAESGTIHNHYDQRTIHICHPPRPDPDLLLDTPPYLLLVRIRFFHEKDLLDHLRRGGKGIVAIWHQRILLVVSYAWRFREFTPAAMISQSRDWDLIADVSRRLNFRPVRGSGSRGGREALAAMVAELSAHPMAVHAVDGPQGSRGLIKAGIIRMVQLSGTPIIPVYISVNRAWILRSWDRFLIPNPSARSESAGIITPAIKHDH